MTKPKMGSEEWSANNVQGRKLEPGQWRTPESTVETLELVEGLVGTSCKDPDTGEVIQRAWISWMDDSPCIYVRVHDLDIHELVTLSEYNFEPHRGGAYLWINTGPFDVWDHFEDQTKEQGDAWNSVTQAD